MNFKNFSSLSNYNDEFMRLIASIGISSEMDKIDKYINGMDREIVQKITIENPKTLSTAMKIANSYSFLIKKTASINYASKQVNFVLF